MDPLQAVLLVAFGFLPSLFWLAFYLRKDWHPEPRYLITRTFFLGLALAPLAVAGQWLLVKLIYIWNPSININSYPLFFLGAALIEEVVKFLAVKFIIINNAEFDEPLDAMIYMITAALGFAAIENILVLFQAFPDGASGAIQIWLYRFAGATFLHALTAAITGYFLALSWFYHKHSQKLIPVGIALATIVHFLFNSIVLTSLVQIVALFRSSILLIITAVMISLFFGNLRKHEERDLGIIPKSE